MANEPQVKHTPGPWKVTYKHGRDCMPTGVHAEENGRTICQQNWMMSRSGNQAEVEANARLIAAASELLEAAKWAQCDCTPRQRDSGHLVGCWMPDLLAAIAKAEGR